MNTNHGVGFDGARARGETWVCGLYIVACIDIIAGTMFYWGG